MRVRVGVHSISFLKYRFQFSVWLYFISVFWFVSCPYLNTYIYIYGGRSILWTGLKQIAENRWYLSMLFGVYAGIMHFWTLISSCSFFIVRAYNSKWFAASHVDLPELAWSSSDIEVIKVAECVEYKYIFLEILYIYIYIYIQHYAYTLESHHIFSVFCATCPSCPWFPQWFPYGFYMDSDSVHGMRQTHRLKWLPHVFFCSRSTLYFRKLSQPFYLHVPSCLLISHSNACMKVLRMTHGQFKLTPRQEHNDLLRRSQIPGTRPKKLQAVRV